jgi:hypothetical protein
MKIRRNNNEKRANRTPRNHRRYAQFFCPRVVLEQDSGRRLRRQMAWCKPTKFQVSRFVFDSVPMQVAEGTYVIAIIDVMWD